MLFLELVNRENYQRFRLNVRKESSEGFTIKNNLTKSAHCIIYNDLVKRGNLKSGHNYCLIKLWRNKNSYTIGDVCYRLIPEPRRSKLINIEILKDYQGRGYGSKTMKIILDEVTRWKSIYMSLFVFNHRNQAINLYRKFGFTIWKKFDLGISMIKYINV